jgi:hypothetical protein
METFLTNAFAAVRLAAIQEFHLSRRSTNVPEPSLLIITSGRPETNKQRREALFHYSMHRDPQAKKACLKHSPLLKVNVTGHLATAATATATPRVSPSAGHGGHGRPPGGEKPGTGTDGERTTTPLTPAGAEIQLRAF